MIPRTDNSVRFRAIGRTSLSYLPQTATTIV